jgi:hypothetical protein
MDEKSHLNVIGYSQQPGWTSTHPGTFNFFSEVS